MRTVEVGNRSRRSLLGRRVAVADRPWSRLRGLLGRPEPEAGEGILFIPSRGVHMYGMRYPLDVVLADPDRRVVALYRGLRPWSRTRVHRSARYALELPVGTIEASGTREGDLLEWGADVASRSIGEGRGVGSAPSPGEGRDDELIKTRRPDQGAGAS